MTLFHYTGVIHLHSEYSFDGHTPIASILEDANRCGIDFLMLTDHNHMQARQAGWEGWHGKTLLIVGQEISPRFNHYLAFNMHAPLPYPETDEGIAPQSYIDEVNLQGGFGFIAHPDHEGTPVFHVKHYGWKDWTVQNYAGIGIWDFMTDWQSSLQSYISGFLGTFFPAWRLKGPRPVTLKRWDRLNQDRRVVGIGELDNHATIKKFLGQKLVLFPFRQAFRFIRTHVLTRQALSGKDDTDKDILFEALLAGRCYVALDYFRLSRGFEFSISANDQVYYMGDRLPLADHSIATVRLPAKAKIRLLRNGKLKCETVSTEMLYPIDQPGVYRVEAYLKVGWTYRPWIFSNPIVLG